MFHVLNTPRHRSLVHAFVLSRLDYGNSALASLTKSTIARPCDPGPASVALVARTPAQHKLCTMMHTVLYAMCTEHLADTVSASADNPTRPRLRSAVSIVHGVSATKMSCIRGRACVLLLKPTHVKRPAFNNP